MNIIESSATAAKRYGFISARTEWDGFAGMLEYWIKAPQFSHTHYLDTTDYAQAFPHIFLMLGRLRKRLIAVRVQDTGAGDDKDEIRLIADDKKFKIRPI